MSTRMPSPATRWRDLHYESSEIASEIDPDQSPYRVRRLYDAPLNLLRIKSECQLLLPKCCSRPSGCSSFANLFPIPLYRIAQSVFEWSEPALVIPPLKETIAKDRLADLFGAGCGDCALGLVKLEARWFKLKGTETKDASHVCLQMLHDIFVAHSQYSSGQDCVPVSHQVEISPVVTGDVFHAIGELLSAGK